MKKKSINKLLFQIITFISISIIITFIFRNIVVIIFKNKSLTLGTFLYSFFNGKNNKNKIIYIPSKLKEVDTLCNTIFLSFSIRFQNGIMDKFVILKDRI